MEPLASPTETSLLPDPSFDVMKIRESFPILHQEVRPSRPLIYLDSAASCQTPTPVIEAIRNFYTEDYANIHRGLYDLSQKATQLYEEARSKIQRFLNASSAEEIVFVRGTTEAINLVAHSFGETFLEKGDEIIISQMEHHSNIVPWQLLAQRLQLKIKMLPMTHEGTLQLEALESLISPKTKLLSLLHVSNSLGTINPIEQFIDIAHQHGIPVLIDGAQAAPHLPIDVQKWDCDFYVLSGHKMYGPTGIGALYAKKEWLQKMHPYQGGGDMIRSVSFQGSTFAAPPAKFEAGTPNIAGAIGLGAAIDWIQHVGLHNIERHEQLLLQHATQLLSEIPGLRIFGQAPQKASVLSFTIDGIHPFDISTILNHEGIAIRTGQHCTQPIMDFFGITGTARASFAAYNTKEEVEQLALALQKVLEIFR